MSCFVFALLVGFGMNVEGIEELPEIENPDSIGLLLLGQSLKEGPDSELCQYFCHRQGYRVKQY